MTSLFGGVVGFFENEARGSKKKKVWKHSVKPHPIHMVRWSVQINNRYCEKGTPKGKEEVYYFYFSKNSKPDFFFPLVRLVDSKKNRISPAYLHPSALLLKSGVNPGLFMTTTLHRFFFCLPACIPPKWNSRLLRQAPLRGEKALSDGWDTARVKGKEATPASMSEDSFKQGGFRGI